jgi:hypothetical protein
MWPSALRVFQDDILRCSQTLKDGPLSLVLARYWAFLLIGLTVCGVLLIKGQEKILVTLLSSCGLYLVWEKAANGPLSRNVYVEELPVFVAGFLLFSVINLYYHLVRD